jgi:excinuclease ABC subunit C
LLSPLIPAEEDLLRLWLEQEREGRVEFLYPKKGNKLKLINLARANAEMLLGEKRRETETRDRFAHSIQALKENLKLPQMPVIIEAFDISNTAGSEPVASLVVFKNGRPLKSEYRIFNIKSVAGIDDCAMMMEAVSRRYARVLKEAGTLPNLILIDGGKGQLSSAIKSLKKLNLSTLPVIGLAKRLDEIYLPAPSEPLNLPRTSSALKLLQQIRDEAHRFAISHHRKRRAKSGLKSILDQIPGVGKVRKERLMKHFKTLEKIKVAKIEELVSISGIDRKTAKSIYDYFSTLNLKDKKAEV